jgi:hypothetical protein
MENSHFFLMNSVNDIPGCCPLRQVVNVLLNLLLPYGLNGQNGTYINWKLMETFYR